MKPNKIIMKLEKSDYIQYLKSPDCAPDIPVYLTDTAKGRAHTETYNQFITVPKWAFNRSWNYFIYYVAHELAHINDWNIFKNSGHKQTFYDCFQQLCPDNLQHFELNYKVSFGARIEHKHEFNTILFKDGIQWVKCRYCKSKHLLK